jgi:glycyl-tRNA synthetase beta chain
LENGLRLQLRNVFRQAASSFDPARYGLSDPSGDLLDFIADRLKVHMRGEGFGYVGDIKLLRLRHDLIAAVFALEEDDLVRLLARAAELAGFLATNDGENLLVAYRRASNIVSIEERRDNRSYNDPIDPSLLQQPEEIKLYQSLNGMSVILESSLANEHFGRAMTRLATLRAPVDEFFDNVTVNVGEPKWRANRLRLLSGIRETMNRVADFSQIEG